MAHELSHFARVRELLRLEEQAEEERFAEARAGKTLAELAAEGLALVDLEAVDEAWGLGGRLVVTFAGERGRELEGSWQPGAVVLVSPARAELAPVRAVVARRERRRLHVAFDEPPPPYVGAGRVVILASADNRTFERAHTAVAEVAALEKGAARQTRDVLLAAAPPRFSETKPKLSPALNPEQAEAARRALAAQDFFLVHGPPGTGKSTVLAEVARGACERGKLLATAQSNAAVDHLLELLLERGLSVVRLGHPARVSASLQAHTLDELVREEPDWQIAEELWDEAAALSGFARRQRQTGRSRERFKNARGASAEARSLRQEARQREARAIATVLGRAQIVGSTLTALWGRELAEARFELALLDEATQAIEPLALGAFLRARVVVLAGDHLQLPPTILSPRAAAEGLSRSLFERLLEDHGADARVMLREQHRMSEALIAFPSRETYGGELRTHPRVALRRLDLLVDDVGGASMPVPPLLFVDTAGRGFDEEQPEGSSSFRNPGEARLLIARAKDLVRAGLPAGEVGVIAPYSAQVAELRALAALHPELEAVEIDSVDAFQGREKEAILLSLTRANAEGAVGFLADLRRINVAITRARAHLFLLGDSGTVSRHPYYERLIEAARQAGGYRSVWEWPGAEAL